MIVRLSATPAVGVPDAGASVNAVGSPKMSMLAPVLAVVVSLLVATVNDVFAYVPSTGLTMPAIVSVPRLLAVSVQPTPIVIVTVVATVEAAGTPQPT